MPRDEDAFETEDSQGYVPALFARTAAEAEYYRELLSDHDIPAMVGVETEEGADAQEEEEDETPGMSRGVPVMVPEAFLDEASEIIADHDEIDEYESEEEEDEEEDEDLGLDEEELGEDLEEEDLDDEEEEDEEEEDEEEEESEDDELVPDEEEDEFLDDEDDEEEEQGKKEK